MSNSEEVIKMLNKLAELERRTKQNEIIINSILDKLSTEDSKVFLNALRSKEG